MDRKGHKAVIRETRKNEKEAIQIERNSYQRMSWGLKEWLFSISCVRLLSEVLSGSNSLKVYVASGILLCEDRHVQTVPVLNMV